MSAPFVQFAKFPLFLVVLVSEFLLFPMGARATTELILQLDSSWRYDSNPLRFTDDAKLPAALGINSKQDTILSNDVRVLLVQPLDSPETRLVFTGQLGHRSYRELTQLTNTEYAYNASLEWRSGEIWKGKLSHSEEQQLYDYLNGTLTTRDMIHRMTDNAAVSLQLTPDIEIPFTIRVRRDGYDISENQVFNSNERSLDASIHLRSTTSSNISIGLRSTDVLFPLRNVAQANTLDSGYQDKELYLASDWQYSVLTRLSGRIAAMQRTYATLDLKNFSAVTAELKILHDYSARTRLTAELWTRPYPITDSAILYTTASGAQLGAKWQSTEKTQVTMMASKEQQQHQYANTVPGQLNPTLNRVRVGGSLTYAVTRDMQFYVDGFRDQLDQGLLGGNIGQTVLRTGLEYTFENIGGLAQRTGFGKR